MQGHFEARAHPAAGAPDGPVPYFEVRRALPPQHRPRQAWQSSADSPQGFMAHPGAAQSSRPRLRPTSRTTGPCPAPAGSERTRTPPHPVASPPPTTSAAVRPTIRPRQPHPQVAASAARTPSPEHRSGPSRDAAGTRTGSMTLTSRLNRRSRRPATASRSARNGSGSTGTSRIAGDIMESGSTTRHVAFSVGARRCRSRRNYEIDKSREIPSPLSTAGDDRRREAGTIP